MSVSGQSKEIDAILSSSLFTRIRKPSALVAKVQAICPQDELNLFSNALQNCWAWKVEDKVWEQLLEVSNLRSLEVSSWRWPSHLGSILGFKLFCILSGSASTEGSIPRSVLSPESKAGLERVAKIITEDTGWPRIFEEAFIARWNTSKARPAPVAPSTIMHQSPTQNASTKVAQSVAENLMRLGQSQVSRQFDNILSNIQLAAAYLSIMTLGVIDVTSDKELHSKLDGCMNGLGLEHKLSSVLKNLNLSLTELQAPLFSALSVSPILLFRTCLLQSSRFGKHHYVALLLSLGDIKPASLREIENLIWQDLFRVARCQLHPQEMANHILDFIIEPSLLDTFCLSNRMLRDHFKQKFDPIRDHTSFFFPDIGVVVKQEAGESSSGYLETVRQTPAPEAVYGPSSAPSHTRTSDVFFPPDLPDLPLSADLIHRLSSKPSNLRLNLPNLHSLSGPNSRVSLTSTDGNSILAADVQIPSNLLRQYILRRMGSETSASTGIGLSVSVTTGTTVIGARDGETANTAVVMSAPRLSGVEDVQQMIPGPRDRIIASAGMDVLTSADSLSLDEPPAASTVDPHSPQGNRQHPAGRLTPEVSDDAAVSIRLENPVFVSTTAGASESTTTGVSGSEPVPLSGSRAPVSTTVGNSESTTTGVSVSTASGARDGEQVNILATESSINPTCPSSVEETQHTISHPKDLVISPVSRDVSTSVPSVSVDEPVTGLGVESSAAGTSASMATGAQDCEPVTPLTTASHMDPQYESSVEGVQQMTPDPTDHVVVSADSVDPTSADSLSLDKPSAVSTAGSQQVAGRSTSDTIDEVTMPVQSEGASQTDLVHSDGPAKDSVFEPNNADDVDQECFESAPSQLPSSTPQQVSPSSPRPSSPSSSQLSSPPISQHSPCPASPGHPGSNLDPGHDDSHPENDDADSHVIARHSARIAAKKRKLEDEEDTDYQTQKRAKLAEGSKGIRMKKRKARISRASADDDMDIDDELDELEDDEEEIQPAPVVARFVIDEDADTEFVYPPVIHVYSADCTRYFAYEGKHYNALIAQDLEALAEHVEGMREKIGLPYGQHSSWVKGMTVPTTISPPPLLRTDPDAYPIFTMTFSDFYPMSTKDMLAIFRRYPVIVVSGRPTRLRCDIESLEEWGDPDELRVMHDSSKYNPANPSAVFVDASYREFLTTSKCLNSLDNPLGGSSLAPIQLATDLHAAGSTYEGFPRHLPMRVMNWGLLAKAHAVHPPHADRPGSCTWVAIEDGLKKWDIGFPPANMDEEETASPSAYGNGMASGRNFARGWRWTSLLLHPGTMLIMRPGVVHSVATLQDCIALGGHFFSLPTIKYSLYSIFHTFVGSNTITNVPMDAEQQMLLRILLLWHKTMFKGQETYLARMALDQDPPAHIPNVLNFDDFENLVMLLNYSELVSVVTPSRYSRSSANLFQQNLYRIPRECSRELRHWLLQHFELVLQPPVPDGYDDGTRLEALMLNFLVRQAHTLLDSMQRQKKLGVVGSTYEQDGGDKQITANQVLLAIRSDLSSFPGFISAWEKELENKPSASYCWPAAPGSSRYIMKVRV